MKKKEIFGYEKNAKFRYERTHAKQKKKTRQSLDSDHVASSPSPFSRRFLLCSPRHSGKERRKKKERRRGGCVFPQKRVQTIPTKIFYRGRDVASLCVVVCARPNVVVTSHQKTTTGEREKKKTTMRRCATKRAAGAVLELRESSNAIASTSSRGVCHKKISNVRRCPKRHRRHRRRRRRQGGEEGGEAGGRWKIAPERHRGRA